MSGPKASPPSKPAGDHKDHMSKKTFPGRRLILCLVLGNGALPCAAGDWLTYGHDPARSGWASEEKKISPANAGSMGVQWKTHVDNASFSLSALTAPVVSTHVKTSAGVRSVLYVAGSGGTVFALDAVSGEELWHKALRSMAAPRKGGFQGTFLCPNGITATPVIDNESNTLYVIAPDGSLNGLDLGSGKVTFGPVPYVSPFAKSWSLNLADGVVYTTVSLGCGNGRAGVYAADVRDPHRPAFRQLMLSGAYTAGIWGRGGAVIGEDGRLYGGTADGDTDPAKGDYSNTVVAASLHDLSIADYFLPPNWKYLKKDDLDVGSASPVWLKWKNRNIVAHGFKEGVVYLLDGDSMGGPDHGSPLYATPRLSNDQEQCCDGSGIWGGLSYSRDAKGGTWLYVPVGGPPSAHAPAFPVTNGANPHGSIMAFRMVADPATQKPVLQPAWVSGDFNFPDPPVIANGVVFALSNGENPNQRGDESKRFLNTRPAVLKALDAATGRELYNSGTAISTWVHFSALAIADGMVFAVDHDSNIYGFGTGRVTSVSGVHPLSGPRNQDELSTSWIGRAERDSEYLRTWALRAGATLALVLFVAIAGIWAGSREEKPLTQGNK
jgi:outer membrane protein assembly factor BamB